MSPPNRFALTSALILAALLLPAGLAFAAGSSGPVTVSTSLDKAAFGDGLKLALTSGQHVITGLAVGLWASHSGGRMVWQIPVGLVAGYIVAMAALLSGAALPTLTWGVAGSLILLGLLLASGIRIQPVLAVIVAAAAGFAHCFGDYYELYAQHVIGQDGVALLVAASFGIATALFLLAVGGVGLSVLVRALMTEAGLRLTGVAVALSGFALLDFVRIQVA